MNLVPAAVATVLFPRMLERHAAGAGVEAGRRLLVGVLRALTVLMLPARLRHRNPLAHL